MEEQKLGVSAKGKTEQTKMGENMQIEKCVVKVSKILEVYRAKFEQLNIETIVKREEEMINRMILLNKATEQFIERASVIVNSFAKAIYKFKLPQINLPQISEETRNHFKFMEIASIIGFPVFMETDTQLQDKLVSLCGDYLEEYYPIEEIKQCIYEYYNHDMLMKKLDMWYDQEWILFERRKALKEAIEVYEKGYYFSAGSIIMCQLGGLINELFDATDFSTLMTLEERKNINALYNVGKIDSEKAKVLQMMSMQDNGIFQWYKSAEYMMNHTYSSTEDITRFEHDPGRHKICHGVQTNYGTKEHALKAILVADIVIQLGEQMLHSERISA